MLAGGLYCPANRSPGGIQAPSRCEPVRAKVFCSTSCLPACIRQAVLTTRTFPVTIEKIPMKNMPHFWLDTQSCRRSPYTLTLPFLLAGCIPYTEPSLSTPYTQQTVDALITTALASQNIRVEKSIPAVIPTAVATIAQPHGLHHVKYTGSPASQPKLTTLSGKNQTLPVALQSIAPPGWHIVLSQALERKAPYRVSWKGGDQWPWVLEKLANQYHLNITIMWASQQVTVDIQTATAAEAGKHHPAPMPQTQPAQLSAVQVSSPARSAKSSPALASSPAKKEQSSPAPESSSVTPAPSSQVARPAPVATSIIWRAETGQTLKDVLFTWAATADCQGRHWTVDWVTPVNYRIDAPLSFTGSWRDALNEVFGLYRNAATPLYAGTATAQCILKVDSKPMQ